MCKNCRQTIKKKKKKKSIKKISLFSLPFPSPFSLVHCCEIKIPNTLTKQFFQRNRFPALRLYSSKAFQFFANQLPGFQEVLFVSEN